MKPTARRTVCLLLLLLAFHVCYAQDVRPKDQPKYKQAMRLIEARKYHDAAAQLRRLASQNLGSADVQYQLGLLAVKEGFNTAGIRRYFSKCIDLQPNYPQPLAHYYMALVHYTDDRFDQAVDELNIYFSMTEGSNDREANAVYDEASNYLYWSQFLAEAALSAAPYEPQRVQGVSSTNNEMLPYLSADGRTFYYLREVPTTRNRTYYSRQFEDKRWMLYYSILRDSTYSAGAAMPAPFNSGLPEGIVSLTADGNELYYSVIHDVQGYANSDIYCVQRKEGVWQQPQACGPQVNGDHSWEGFPTVSADGQLLIFASNRKGGVGGIDLWQCHRLPNGDWSRATNLGTGINTPGNEKAPFLAADGHTLYFLSDGWQGFGGHDIYFANLYDPYANRPTNLGLPINTEGDELSFGVTTDGTRAYLSGRTEGGRSSDVLMFDLYPNARPESMQWIEVELNTLPPNTTATVWYGDYKQRFAARGSRFPILASTEQENIVAVCSDSCLPYIVSLSPRNLPRSSSQRLSLQPLAVGANARLDMHHLDAWAQWLVDHPRVHLAIECPKRSDAEQVFNYFKDKGLRPERFTLQSGTAVSRPQVRVTAL